MAAVCGVHKSRHTEATAAAAAGKAHWFSKTSQRAYLPGPDPSTIQVPNVDLNLSVVGRIFKLVICPSSSGSPSRVWDPTRPLLFPSTILVFFSFFILAYRRAILLVFWSPFSEDSSMCICTFGVFVRGGKLKSFLIYQPDSVSLFFLFNVQTLSYLM